MAKQIIIDHVFKVFGDDPKTALDLVQQGLSKQEILERTGQSIGVFDANFTIEAGEIFVVMGLSGSGKSTLVRMLNRLIEPTAGRIVVDGQDINALSERDLRALRRKDISMVFQSFALMPHMTVLDNTAFGLELAGADKAERQTQAQAALEQVGLGAWGASYPDELSGGMQQRVGLARALASDPSILLMDEAFSALDPIIRTEMQSELLRLQQIQRRTIVFISHDLDEAMRIGDRIAIMKDGQVIQVGTPDEILRSPADDYVRSFVRGVDAASVFKAGDIARQALTVVSEHSDRGLPRGTAPAGRLRPRLRLCGQRAPPLPGRGVLAVAARRTAWPPGHAGPEPRLPAQRRAAVRRHAGGRAVRPRGRRALRAAGDQRRRPVHGRGQPHHHAALPGPRHAARATAAGDRAAGHAQPAFPGLQRSHRRPHHRAHRGADRTTTRRCRMSDATNSLNPNTAAAATDPWADASAAPASTDSAASAASASADPWATAATPPPDASADPWGAASGGDAAGGDWLGASAGSGVPDDAHASLWHQLTTDGLPVQGWINSGLEWVVHHFPPLLPGRAHAHRRHAVGHHRCHAGPALAAADPDPDPGGLAVRGPRHGHWCRRLAGGGRHAGHLAPRPW